MQTGSSIHHPGPKEYKCVYLMIEIDLLLVINIPWREMVFAGGKWVYSEFSTFAVDCPEKLYPGERERKRKGREGRGGK